MPIALFSDLVSILTVHIYSFYIASARIFNWQLTIIISLFHLFRGKKRNVLRNRIDSCDYDLDQLLLGTILFTVLFFLLPTVIVFYLAFASARMLIISLKAALDTCLAFLNHFPLFALMLRVKDSRRLPGAYIPRIFQGYITNGVWSIQAGSVSNSGKSTTSLLQPASPRLAYRISISSPFRSRFVPCSTSTSNWAIVSGNTTSPRGSSSASSPAASCLLSTVATSTACSTACSPRAVLP